MSYCPDWYKVIQAAKYLNVPPWELMEQPLFWYEKALISMTAEAGAQEQRIEMERRKNSK